MKVRALVVVHVDRLDGHLGEVDGVLGAGEKHVHLVLVPLATDVEEGRDETGREGSQARLGVAHVLAGAEFEDEPCDEVADAAAPGYALRIEGSAAQNEGSGILGGHLSAAFGVDGRVLAIPVDRHDDGVRRVVLLDVLETDLEGDALAAVVDVRDERRTRRGEVEERTVSHAAAIVHDDLLHAELREGLQHLDEMGVWLVRGNEGYGLGHGGLPSLDWNKPMSGGLKPAERRCRFEQRAQRFKRGWVSEQFLTVTRPAIV